ncbi:hypothetical protein [Kitasatospora sp. NPDC018619]|uniref:hypothetical protein n=1 Tax=unclassified Kitasatospora TaxID=2633591 RepID=UPI0037B21D82
MDGREQAELRGIERGLHRDRVLELRLRILGLRLRGRAWEVLRGVRPRTVLALVLLSLGLLAAGLGTSEAPFLWIFTGCWALTLTIAFAVLCACADGRREEG